MTQTTDTLAGFLLARIAEDEQRAREDGADAMVGWRWKHYPQEAYEKVQSLTLETSRRTLARCKADRRIVERCSAVDYAMPSTHLAHGILAELAVPYAEHPDYRDEWKP